MLTAPMPAAHEPERIASLRRMRLLSTPDEEIFDRVTRCADALLQRAAEALHKLPAPPA